MGVLEKLQICVYTLIWRHFGCLLGGDHHYSDYFVNRWRDGRYVTPSPGAKQNSNTKVNLGLLWGYIATVIGFAFVYLSLSELASISPTSGGQYRMNFSLPTSWLLADIKTDWISEFAPRSAQKFLSYLVGWLCFTGWQVIRMLIHYIE